VEPLGRDRELGLLRDAAARARAGRGQVVVLSGEPGIGKTTLAEALAAEAAAAGDDVTRGRAWELADAPAFFPLWPCLRALGLRADAAAGRGDAGAFHLWEEVLEALARATAARPALWLLEDLHAADLQTLDLLCFLAQPVRALRALLVVTARPRDPRAGEPVRRRLVRLARDGLEIALQPLAAGDVGALVARHAGRALDPAAVAALAARTGGNPLFVVECARTLHAGGPGTPGAAALPATVSVLVGERVGLLPDETRALLADAAVLGNDLSVTAAALGQMTGALPARVIDGLAPALRAGILDELEPGRFRFSHALVRDAIYEAAAPAARAAAHARAERALATLGDAPAVVLERARHALAALAPGREADAVAACARALALLEDAGTYDRAFALARQLLAARAAGALPPAGPLDLVHAGALALGASNFAESRRLCLEALELARAAGDAPAFAAAALALGAEMQPGMIDAVLVRHLEEALALLGPAPSPLRIRVSARLAAAQQPAHDPGVPAAMARAAIADARASGDAALLADTLTVAFAALSGYVDPLEERAIAEECLALARARPRPDPAPVLRAYARVVVAAGETGDFEALDRALDSMLGLAAAVGHPRLTWRALLLGSMRAIARGRFDESERLIAEVQRLAQLTDDPALPATLGGHVYERAIALHLDELRDGLLAGLDAAMDEVAQGAFMRPFLRAQLLARLGDREGAAHEMNGVPLAHGLRRSSPSWLGGLGEIYAAAGTPEELRLLGELLAPVADRDILVGHITISYGGPMRRVMGLVAAAQGDTDGAARLLGEAREIARRRGHATWVARISCELGEILHAAGRGGAAAAALEEAVRVAGEIPIPGLARRARRLLGPAAGSAPPPDPARPGVAAPERALAPAAPAAPAALALRREGDLWRVTYGDRSTTVLDSRGMELLARLVERPGEELHVLVLAGGGQALHEPSPGDALDATAARSYRARLAALEDELAAAEAAADAGRAELARREHAFLQAELSRAFGLGGAPRPAGSSSERARVNVQRRLKDAIARIAEHDAAIGAYLRAAVRTGTFCTFRP